MGLPRTAVDVCDEAHLREIVNFVDAHGITPDRLVLFVHIASTEVDQMPLPDVALSAIRQFRTSDVQVTVVPPYNEE